MMLGLLAQVAGPQYSIGQLLIGGVILAACVALVYIAMRQFGVAIPQWVVQVFWVLVVAVVIIFSIRFVLGL